MLSDCLSIGDTFGHALNVRCHAPTKHRNPQYPSCPSVAPPRIMAEKAIKTLCFPGAMIFCFYEVPPNSLFGNNAGGRFLTLKKKSSSSGEQHETNGVTSGGGNRVTIDGYLRYSLPPHCDLYAMCSVRFRGRCLLLIVGSSCNLFMSSNTIYLQ